MDILTAGELQKVLELFNEPDAIFMVSSYGSEEQVFMPKRFIFFPNLKAFDDKPVIYLNPMGSHHYDTLIKGSMPTKIVSWNFAVSEYQLTILK